MKAITIQITNQDYDWLEGIGKQRQMTVEQLIAEMVRDKSLRAEKETQFILNNPELKKRLDEALNTEDTYTFDEARERLGF